MSFLKRKSKISSTIETRKISVTGNNNENLQCYFTQQPLTSSKFNKSEEKEHIKDVHPAYAKLKQYSAFLPKSKKYRKVLSQRGNKKSLYTASDLILTNTDKALEIAAGRFEKFYLNNNTPSTTLQKPCNNDQQVEIPHIWLIASSRNISQEFVPSNYSYAIDGILTHNTEVVNLSQDKLIASNKDDDVDVNIKDRCVISLKSNEDFQPCYSQKSNKSIIKISDNLNVKDFLQKIYQDSDYTDVCFQSNDHTLFFLHKIILLAKFPQILKIYQNKFKNGTMKIDLNGNQLERFIKYIYFGELQIDHWEIQSFYNTAKKLKMSQLLENINNQTTISQQLLISDSNSNTSTCNIDDKNVSLHCDTKDFLNQNKLVPLDFSILKQCNTINTNDDSVIETFPPPHTNSQFANTSSIIQNSLTFLNDPYYDPNEFIDDSFYNNVVNHNIDIPNTPPIHHDTNCIKVDESSTTVPIKNNKLENSIIYNNQSDESSLNITHYSMIETPELKKKISSYGIRNLPKNKMVPLLKQISRYTKEYEKANSNPSIS